MFYTKKKFDLSPKLKLGVGRGYNSSQLLKIFGVLFLVLAVGLTAHALTLLLGHTKTAAQNGSPQVLGASDQQNTQGTQQFIEYKVKIQYQLDHPGNTEQLSKSVYPQSRSNTENTQTIAKFFKNPLALRKGFIVLTNRWE